MYAAILQHPEIVVTLRGENATFHCEGSGPILWRINDTLYDYRHTELLSQRGIKLETPQLQAQAVSQEMRVQTSIAGSNNTNFSCTILGSGNETSRRSYRATLVTIGEIIMWSLFERTLMHAILLPVELNRQPHNLIYCCKFSVAAPNVKPCRFNI